MSIKALAAILGLALLAGCAGSGGKGPRAGAGAGEGALAGAPAGRGGAYYLDDGPGGAPPANLDAIPDAVPRPEPVLARTSRPYVVFGREYRPMSRLEPYKARGVATWYGRRYHGNPTSSGERYDMYAMTAAHPTLPIPSYVRVTNLANGRSVVVRVNDRGPFLHDRLIDLSYTAASRLGYVGAGTAQVEVELITEFGQPATVAAVSPLADPPPPERLQVETEIAGQAVTPSAPVALPVAGTGSSPAGGAPTAGSPIPVLQGAYWLQLGAFGSAENARAARERLASQVAEMGAPIDVVPDGGLFKLQAGPWPTREAAQAAAERVRASTELQPFSTRR
jgi:rare lipoprotein A